MLLSLNIVVVDSLAAGAEEENINSGCNAPP